MKRTDLLLSILLVAATAIAYAPAYRGDFIWDDDRHVSQNPLLRTADGLNAIWTDIGATPQYYPLTHTSFWIEWQLWGASVTGYHITNVTLHAIASLLVVLLMRRLQLPGAWLAGFVFALHPLHVESVAWISERKNTLSIVFMLLSLLAYLRSRADLRSLASERAPELMDNVRTNIIHKDEMPEAARMWWFWALSLGLFVAAVLSKTMTCTLPAVILVIVWWKRGRIAWRDVLPLVPFFVIAIGAALLTGGMERRVVGAEGDDWSLSFVERVLVAGRAVWWYAAKVVWPGSLAFSYERWTISTSDWISWAFVISAIGVVIASVLSRERLGRGVAAGVLIFGGTLFPALGFFNLYPHRYSFVADHFQYHSNVALIAMLCAGLASLRVPARLGVAWGAVLISVLGVMSFEQSKIYRNHETLWRDTVAKTPTSWMAHHNLGVTISMQSSDPRELGEALQYLDRAKQLRPHHDRVDWSRGEVLAKLRRDDDAQQAYAAAVALQRELIARDPTSVNPYVRLIEFYDKLNRDDDALATSRSASDARPDIAHFAEQAGTRLAGRLQFGESIVYLEQWARMKPRSVDARMSLANAYDKLDRLLDARRVMLEAAAITPDDPAIRNALSYLSSRLTHPPATKPASAAETRRE